MQRLLVLVHGGLPAVQRVAGQEPFANFAFAAKAVSKWARTFPAKA